VLIASRSVSVLLVKNKPSKVLMVMIETHPCDGFFYACKKRYMSNVSIQHKKEIWTAVFAVIEC